MAEIKIQSLISDKIEVLKKKHVVLSFKWQNDEG